MLIIPRIIVEFTRIHCPEIRKTWIEQPRLLGVFSSQSKMFCHVCALWSQCHSEYKTQCKIIPKSFTYDVTWGSRKGSSLHPGRLCWTIMHKLTMNSMLWLIHTAYLWVISLLYLSCCTRILSCWTKPIMSMITNATSSRNVESGYRKKLSL